jgi:hypothetical protein
MTMPRVSDLKQSRFLTKEDCTPPILVTIMGYAQFNVAIENQSPDNKWALSFHEAEKPMVLNQTNGQLISAILGSDDFDDWIGKKIVLYNDPTIAFAGKITGGIRVRAPKNQAPVAAKPKPSAAQRPAPVAPPAPPSEDNDFPDLGNDESSEIPF